MLWSDQLRVSNSSSFVGVRARSESRSFDQYAMICTAAAQLARPSLPLCSDLKCSPPVTRRRRPASAFSSPLAELISGGVMLPARLHLA